LSSRLLVIPRASIDICWIRSLAWVRRFWAMRSASSEVEVVEVSMSTLEMVDLIWEVRERNSSS